MMSKPLNPILKKMLESKKPTNSEPIQKIIQELKSSGPEPESVLEVRPTRVRFKKPPREYPPQSPEAIQLGYKPCEQTPPLEVMRVMIEKSCTKRQAERLIEIAENPKKPQLQSQNRLPDKAKFVVEYDAETQKWIGSLLIGSDTYSGSKSGVFNLLKELDRQYRDHSIQG